MQEQRASNGNGTSPLDNMRSLETYLGEMMRTGEDPPDHLKGKPAYSVLAE